MSTPNTRSTRQTILEACRSLAEESAPSGWTMEDVADRAGVTRMTVYRYFPSRTQLLVATVHHVDENQQAHERFASLLTSATAIEALDRWVEVWVSYIPKVHRLAEALLAARHTDEAAEEAWQDRMSALRTGCRRVVEWLQAEGSLSAHLTVDTGTDLMWAIASVQVWDALTTDRGWTPQQYAHEMSRILRRALTDE